MKKTGSWKHVKLALYSTLHFCVDLSCIFFLTGILMVRFSEKKEWLLLILLYNYLAFACAALLGILADRWNKNAYFAAAGCMMIAAGYLSYSFPVPAVLLIGLGNSLFHVDGGRQIFTDFPDHYLAPGVFVSTGALGVFWGSTWGMAHVPLWKWFVCLMVLGAACLLLFEAFSKKEQETVVEKCKNKYYGGCLSSKTVCLLSLVVFLRSYYGSILKYTWNKGIYIGLLFTLCVVGGKIAGGFLADRMGVKRTTIVSLGMAAVLAWFSFESPLCGCLSVFFFNMTMPLTLCLLGKLFPQNPGLAFGIPMLCIFLGTLPVMLEQADGLFTKAGLAGLSLLSMGILLVGIRIMKGEQKK